MRTPNLQNYYLPCTDTKCVAIVHQSRSPAACVMTGALNATAVKVSRAPTAGMPAAIVSRLFLVVDGRTRKRRKSQINTNSETRRRRLPLLPSGAGPSSSLPDVTQTVPDGGLARLTRLTQTTSTPVSSTQYAQRNREKQQQDPCFPAIGMNGKTSYVGDSSNLNYLIQQFGNPFGGATDARPLQDHLQGAMLARLGKSTTQQIESLHASTLEHLHKHGVFNLPSQKTSQALLDTYFHHSFVALPILDRSRFLVTLEENSFSHLLLNAIYLTATTYCSDSVIAEAGFRSRYAASHTFYQRAKALYDAGYETDVITTIQATFLMCHWWSGLLEHKDPWYWLGISAGLAQALGMHQAWVFSHSVTPMEILRHVLGGRTSASMRTIGKHGEDCGG